MDESTTREKILKKIRKALIHKTKGPSGIIELERSVYMPGDDLLELQFAQEFLSAGGIFVFCSSERELAEQLSGLSDQKGWADFWCKEESLSAVLSDFGINISENFNTKTSTDPAITLCEALISRTGSVLVSSKQKSGRSGASFPDHHIVVAYTSQLVSDIKDGINLIKTKYGNQIPSMVTLVTGPSRTADIEKTLVLGAHGPKEIYVFLIDDSNLS